MSSGTSSGEPSSVKQREKVRLSPVGFWSYARQDDDLSDGELSRLRTRIRQTLQLQFGRTRIELFQDVAAIPHGEKWEEKIRTAVSDSTFFIPILTPNFLQSKWCCREVALFLEREEALFLEYPDLPRTSRLFPIHFIDIHDADLVDRKVYEELLKRQSFDYRELRYENGANEQRQVYRFAASILNLLLTQVNRPLSEEELARLKESERRQQEEEAAAERKRLEDQEAERFRREEAEKQKREAEEAEKRRLHAEACERRKAEEAEKQRLEEGERKRYAEEKAAQDRREAERVAQAEQEARVRAQRRHERARAFKARYDRFEAAFQTKASKRFFGAIVVLCVAFAVFLFGLTVYQSYEIAEPSDEEIVEPPVAPTQTAPSELEKFTEWVEASRWASEREDCAGTEAVLTFAVEEGMEGGRLKITSDGVTTSFPYDDENVTLTKMSADGVDVERSGRLLVLTYPDFDFWSLYRAQINSDRPCSISRDLPGGSQGRIRKGSARLPTRVEAGCRVRGQIGLPSLHREMSERRQR